MDNQQDGLQSDAAVKIILIVSGIIICSTFAGMYGLVEITDSLGTVATWIWIGIGLAAVYLLYDISTTLRQLKDSS